MSNGRGNYPKPVYESLPWIYIAVGVVVMASLDSAIGFLSGMLLIAAGALVFLWRAVARSKRKRDRSTARRARSRA